MPSAEAEDRGQVERVAERVGDHHGLGLPGHVGRLELRDVQVAGDGVVVDEDGDGAVLDDGRDGGREAGGAGDDLVAGPDASGGRQLVRGQGAQRDEVRGGARVDEQHVPDAEEVGEALLHRGALLAEGEPKIERRADRGLDFLRAEDAGRVGDAVLGRVVGRTRRMIRRQVTGVDRLRICPRQAEDFLANLCGRHEVQRVQGRPAARAAAR